MISHLSLGKIKIFCENTRATGVFDSLVTLCNLAFFEFYWRLMIDRISRNNKGCRIFGKNIQATSVYDSLVTLYNLAFFENCKKL